MTAISPRHLLLAFAAAPLALALSACKGEQAAAPATSEAIAKVAPPAGQKWEETATPTAEGGMLLGNPNAAIKLVEYGSLSCPHCAAFAQQAMEPLKTEFIASGRVSYEYRSFAIHPQDIPLTMLVRCGSKDLFFPLVEQIYSNFEALNSVMEQPDFRDKYSAAVSVPAQQRPLALAGAFNMLPFFAARGISTDQATACLANFDVAKEIGNNAQKYGEEGINSTPTFFLNGRKIEGEASTWPSISEALRSAGAR